MHIVDKTRDVPRHWIHLAVEKTADRQLLGSSRPRMIPTSQELGAKRCVKIVKTAESCRKNMKKPTNFLFVNMCFHGFCWFLRFHSFGKHGSKTSTTTRTAPVTRDWRCRSSEDSDLVRLLTSIHRHYNNSFTDREKQAEADRPIGS